MYNDRMTVILAAFGLTRKSKLPVYGAFARKVCVWWKNGQETVCREIIVWINPLPLGPVRYKRSTHRVMARCLRCEKTLSAGRIHQHVCKHSSDT